MANINMVREAVFAALDDYGDIPTHWSSLRPMITDAIVAGIAAYADEIARDMGLLVTTIQQDVVAPDPHPLLPPQPVAVSAAP